MRRQPKPDDSRILAQGLAHGKHNEKIRDILLEEQCFFCAYTDEPITRTDAHDIEHFDPTLKDTDRDGYQNWFAVKHQWNLEKSTKWSNYQPILHPSSEDFEDRIKIDSRGVYFCALPDDGEAENLINLLNLNDDYLRKKRGEFISRMNRIHAGMHDVYKSSLRATFEKDPDQRKYPRAVRDLFGIDLYEMNKKNSPQSETE